ncbi:probable LRR receptor-like serine/threonine-protein kinase At3g47570 [Argentina anserina]|uniref:probable LRR receptor-like serine/threonine-protein kinase At3g47570 n=1 Tax=Argentina anserina TaxID=57926 RepID=UPI0021763930|nr:probable LRR receptor-like serine/threonine-protein kinase At3g47570 [Potentilla anserina]
MDFNLHTILRLQLSMLALLLFLSVGFAIIPSINTDKEALISFKEALINAPPSLIWDQNTSPCSNWTGVVCRKHDQNQRVVGLDLSGLGLTGSISSHIGNLSFLRSLQLQNNKLTGAIPTQVVNLFRLRSLNLSSNTIQGPLPSNMSHLTALEILDLAGNNITERLPEKLFGLSKLRVLNLARNHFFGSLSPSISNLSSTLTYLNLGTNSLSGIIPSEVGLLNSLKELDLSGNKFTGTVAPSIYNITSLVLFTVASNQLWGEIPKDIDQTLPNILYYRNCFNLMTGKIPASLHNITKIRSIRMSNNFLEGTVPPGLGNLPDLEMYNIGFNRIVSNGSDGLSFITSLANSTNLQFLAIDDNQLEGVIPDSLGNLSKVLSILYMGGNRIYGNIPASVGRLSGLTLFNVSYNSISGEIPTEIGQLKNMQVLTLAGNEMAGHIPNSLGNLKKLNEIDLSGNHFVGQIPSSFSNFQSLLSMDLSNNQLNGTISGETLNLPTLSTILNLSKNFLTGHLPSEIGSLVSLVTIDLSDNGLSGDIPGSLGKCKSLERLLMSRNRFSGPIPNGLGELRGLEFLDLSSNQLSSSIPENFQDLLALQYLNLSFNHLEGVTPNGGVFVKNFTAVHLEGNPKICLKFPCAKKNISRIIVPVLVITVVLATICVTLGLVYAKKGKDRKAKIAGSDDLLVKGQHQMVSYEELRRSTENFNPGNLVGRGSFGSVYKGFLRDQGIEVAVKVLDIRPTGSWKSFLSECNALRSVRHRNLVKLITSCSSLDSKNMEFLALVYEYMSNGSLEDWIKGKRTNADRNGLSIVERLNMAIDVACGLDYLHNDCEVPVAHCDLKPSNILVDEDMTAKIGDFGLAKLLIEESDQHSIGSTNVLKGSIGYIPPEYGFGQKPSTAGDAYSFGVMLLELFTGKSPTDEDFTGDLNLVQWVQSSFPHNIAQVLDCKLLHCQHDKGSNPISEELNCLTSVIEVGLSCTSASPDGRISLRDALHKLQTARDTFLKLAHFDSVDCRV